MIAAAAMALSSLSVVGNANRLRRHRPRHLPAVGNEPARAPRVEVSEERTNDHNGKDMEMDSVRDPVCGMSIDPATAAASAQHEGITYWFCSQACREQFLADPGRHL
jgi:P-type Cu+ transporter